MRPDCSGLFFTTHYAAAGAQGATKEFIDRYQQKYGYVPDDVAALTWDSIGRIGHGINTTGAITGDIKKDRESVRKALATVKDFAGITGTMSFTRRAAIRSSAPTSSRSMTRVNSSSTRPRARK